MNKSNYLMLATVLAILTGCSDEEVNWLMISAGLVQADTFANQDKSPDSDRLYGVNGCEVIRAAEGWEVRCPNVKDEERRKYMQNLPAPILPGHSSDFELPEADRKAIAEAERQGFKPMLDYPSRCRPMRIEFSDKTTQLIGFLRRERNSSDWNSLTTEASYNVEQLIRTYSPRLDREATAKFRYGARGGTGDADCAAHFQAGVNELLRIGQLIIDELNKGNRDLAGTGLNGYEHETNK